MPVIAVKKLPGKPQLACLKFPPKIKFRLLVCRSMQVLYKEQGRVIAQKTPEVKARFSFLFFSLPDSADISCPPPFLLGLFIPFHIQDLHSFSFLLAFPGKKNKNKGKGERGEIIKFRGVNIKRREKANGVGRREA